MSRSARPWPLIGACLSAAIAVVSAVSLYPEVRLVNIITLFAGGFGAGAGLVAAIVKRRADKSEQRDASAAADATLR